MSCSVSPFFLRVCLRGHSEQMEIVISEQRDRLTTVGTVFYVAQSRQRFTTAIYEIADKDKAIGSRQLQTELPKA